jgi:hypothetical protein
MSANTPRGSMVDVAAARPDALAHAQWRLIDAVLPGPDSAMPESIALAPVTRAAAICGGATALAVRQASLTSHAMNAVPSLMLAPISEQEACAIAGAIVRQVQALLAQWIDGWTDWVQAAASARPPDTATKLFDQESNLALQNVALWTSQATATARAQEAILVGLSWWLSRRTGGADGAAARGGPSG